LCGKQNLGEGSGRRQAAEVDGTITKRGGTKIYKILLIGINFLWQPILCKFVSFIAVGGGKIARVWGGAWRYF